MFYFISSQFPHSPWKGDALIMMEGPFMTPLPSPPLLIKVACKWNCPPHPTHPPPAFLRSPSCYLTVTHHTACSVLLGFQEGSCFSLPLSCSSRGPMLPRWLRGPLLSEQMGYLCKGEAVAPGVQTELRLWGEGRRVVTAGVPLAHFFQSLMPSDTAGGSERK